RVVTLAVLRDLVGELLQAPGFGLVDRAVVAGDARGDSCRQRVDLRLAQGLTRGEYRLVERRGCASFVWPLAAFAPIAKPLRLSSGFACSCKANGATGTRPRPECGRLYRFRRDKQGIALSGSAAVRMSPRPASCRDHAFRG